MENKNTSIKEDLIKFQNNQNLENILNKIKNFKNDLKVEMTSYGITERVMEKVLKDQEIFNCPGCNTLNLYRIYSKTIPKLEYYKCDKCGEEYLD